MVTDITPVTSAVRPAGFFLFQHATGKALDGNGTDVYFHEVNRGDYQLWTAEPLADSANVLMRHRQSGKVLSALSGSTISLAEYEGQAGQHWRMESLEQGRFVRLVNQRTQQVLDGNGTALYLHDWNEGDYQKWSWAENRDARNWMAYVPDARRVDELSVPGTHDSGTAGVGSEDEPTRECAWYDVVCQAQKVAEEVAKAARNAVNSLTGGVWARCQSQSIREQLNNGIRFLDIRCRHYHDNLLIHHGSFYCNLSFADVLDQCVEFLRQQPSEVILLCVKPEYDAEGNTAGRSFTDLVREHLNRYPEHVSLARESLPLSQLRGKIQLIDRFGGQIGLDANGLTDDGITDRADLYAQDIYKVMSYGRVEKEEAMNTAFHMAASRPHDRRLYINFISGFALESPWAFAQVNNWIASQQIPAGRQRLGIVPMDFPPDYLVAQIIRSNF